MQAQGRSPPKRKASKPLRASPPSTEKTLSSAMRLTSEMPNVCPRALWPDAVAVPQRSPASEESLGKLAID